jgi:hypothetical protein
MKALKHIRYDLYLILLIVLTFLSFAGPLKEYLLPLFVGIGFLFILSGANVFYVLPIPFFMQMSFTDLRDNVQITTIYTTILTILIVIDIILNRKIKRKGTLMTALLFLVLAAVLTHVNSPDLFTTFAGFMQIASILGLYFYFVNTLDTNADNFRLVSKLLLYISVLVSIEMIYVIYESGDLVVEVLKRRDIYLGWENINVVIYANLVSLPLTAYLIHESKVKIIYMILALLSIVGIFLTLSRSSVMTVFVYIVVLVPMMFILSKQRLLLFIQGLLFLTLTIAVAYYLETHFSLLSQYMQAIGSRELLKLDDRIKLLQIAFEKFKEYPIVGSGGLYSSRVILAEYGLAALNYHNTVAQASTLGILGIIGFFYLFAKKTWLIMLSKDSFKWYVLLMLFVTAFVNGTLQPMYFYSTYMVFVFLVVATIEVSIAYESPNSLT